MVSPFDSGSVTAGPLFLHTAIQHHPSRAHLLPELLARLEVLNPQVIEDPGGRQRSTWRTHRLCLESIPDDATHLLVLQDDAIPCSDFPAAIRAAIADHPDRILAAFAPGVGFVTRAFNKARLRGDRYLELQPTSFVPLVAVVYPRAHAQAIPAYADARRMSIGRADDAVVSTYTRAHRIGVLATVPCLVEHLDSEPSIMGMASGNGRAHRLAAWFADEPATV